MLIISGIIGNPIAGFTDAWSGDLIFGEWGSILSGFSIIPAII
ncbi:hypothetical protein [Priestia megaterium]